MRFRFLFILCLFISTICFAQQTLVLNNVKKIDLIDRGGGLGGGHEAKYSIFNEGGNWICYREYFSLSSMWHDKHEDDAKKEMAISHKYIKKVSLDVLQSLLMSAQHIKPRLNWKDFNISAQTLITYNDTSLHAGWVPKKWKGRFEKYYSDSTIKVAIEALQHDSWTDDGPFCGIHIIGKNNDTVKIESYRQVYYMLPWKVNKVESYDMSITNFFVEVTDPGLYYSNRLRMKGTYFPQLVTNYIYTKFAKNIFEYDNWFHDHPVNLAFLKANFGVTFSQHNANGGDECYLSSTLLPQNMFLKAVVNIEDEKSIERLIRHRDSIAMYVGRHNFVFDHCINKEGVTIIFPWQYFFNTTSWLDDKYVHDHLHQLKGYDLTQAIYFEVVHHKPGLLCESHWLLLTDNKLVLLAHSGDEAANIPDDILKKQRDDIFNGQYLLFSEKGNLLEQAK
ncbi:hypothetical protein KXQ82_08290 [Mucilaginibacter sp. HMF5004]|uniref:hypothetical protein n=1 Tax=Mucilaginibacter rivuli TaxID=2857527 RepID=UPI001C5EF46C|nr:hypothetical protein [Mucilaginibacter rivuli]MBW4889712.1 hypothetical protein [Mucilaginibacter rivuli]